jgi:hypothetical protein
MTAEIPVIRQHEAQSHAGESEPGRDERPALPRRTRQTHLVPQLQAELPVSVERQAPPETELPSAEHARDRMAAFQRGTRLGREIRPDTTT